MKRKPIIAIDGPVGSGKSTVAKLVAEKLGLNYIDTGAMYRTITFKALKNKINPKDEVGLTKLANETEIQFKYGDTLRVFMDGVEVTNEIRTPEVSKSTSNIADSLGVRKTMVRLQQEIGKEGGIIMDGRDIGSVVFPDAEFKFYIDATIDERAKRRYKEFVKKLIKANFEEVKNDIIYRDERDKTRPYGALKLVKNAIRIDTTNMTTNEVVDMIVSKVRGDRR